MRPADHETEAIADGTLLGPPISSAAPLGSERAEPANVATSTIFVPDDDRRPPGGATIFVPEDDRQPPGAASTLFVPDDDPAGRTMTDVLGRRLRRRGFLLAASLALVLAVAALAVLAYSSSRSSTSAEGSAVAAERSGEQPNRTAAQDDPPIEARPRCTYRPERRGDATMTVTCTVSNHGPIWTRVRVTAWLGEGEGARRVGAENALLAPDELVPLRFDAPAPAHADRGSRCDCRVEVLR